MRLTEQEISNAIFVRLECLGRMMEPALLGVLRPVSEAGDFKPFVLNPTLHAPPLGRRTICVRAATEDAVVSLLHEAEERNALLVSWSNHERHVVGAACDRTLFRRFCGVHRSALETAQPWKQQIYPTFRFQTRPVGESHPLEEYFRLIGYDLQARRARSSAKRDWHTLLERIEHHCRGMRLMMLRAARELDLWQAYLRTHFVVRSGFREITIHVGRRNPELDAVLDRPGATRWAYLTAYNPESIALPAADNAKAQQRLIDTVRCGGFDFLAGEGRDPAGTWSPEPSILIVGIGQSEARRIGRDFGQLALLTGRGGRPAHLVPSGLAADRHLLPRTP